MAYRSFKMVLQYILKNLCCLHASFIKQLRLNCIALLLTIGFIHLTKTGTFMKNNISKRSIRIAGRTGGSDRRGSERTRLSTAHDFRWLRLAGSSACEENCARCRMLVHDAGSALVRRGRTAARQRSARRTGIGGAAPLGQKRHLAMGRRFWCRKPWRFDIACDQGGRWRRLVSDIHGRDRCSGCRSTQFRPESRRLDCRRTKRYARSDRARVGCDLHRSPGHPLRPSGDRVMMFGARSADCCVAGVG